MVSGWRIGRDVEGSTRDLFWGNIPKLPAGTQIRTKNPCPGQHQNFVLLTIYRRLNDLLCTTGVCRCAEVVLIASVVFVEDDPIFYSGVDSVFPSVVFCYLLSTELVTPSRQTKSVTFPAILFADRLKVRPAYSCSCSWCTVWLLLAAYPLLVQCSDIPKLLSALAPLWSAASLRSNWSPLKKSPTFTMTRVEAGARAQKRVA